MIRFLSATLVLLSLSIPLEADDSLPFDPGEIHRSSLDGVPRSLSIRQGDVWLGYDLERGTPFHVWTAPSGKPGLIVKEFVTQSDGEARFSDVSTGTWRILNREEVLPGELHYLSCSDHGRSIELRWELRHDGGNLILTETVAKQTSPEAGSPNRVVRLLEVTGLEPGQHLSLPDAVAEQWTLVAEDGEKVDAVKSDGTYQLVLP